MDFSGKRAVIGADGQVSAVDLTEEEVAQRATDQAAHESRRLAREQRAAREATFLADADRLDLLDRLRTATASQIDAFVDNNIADLADVRRMLKRIIKIVALNVQR